MISKLLLPLALAATSAFGVPQNIHKRDVAVISNCIESGFTAMTYDDGPYLYELDIANNMDGHKGTFFFNGNNWDCIYNHADTLRALYAGSHTMGNHGWSHVDLTTISAEQIDQQVALVEDAFIKILGVKPRLFRPPYGAYNQDVLNVLTNRGYTHLVLWSDDTLDGDNNGNDLPAAEAVYSSIHNDYPNPHLVLEHSVYASTANQLVPFAIQQLESGGYQIAAVDTCLGSQGSWPYTWVSEPGTPDASWTCDGTPAPGQA